MKLGYFIFGRGGLYSIILEILGTDNYLGYFDDKLEDNSTPSYLGPIRHFYEEKYAEGSVMVGIGALRYTLVRASLLDRLQQEGRLLINAISEKAYISSSARYGVGNIICPTSHVGTNVKIGNGNIVFSQTTIEHDSVVGNNVNIAPGVTISGKVKIEDNVFIGAGSSIADGITVRKNAVIGAGSVVIRDIEADSIYHGNPATLQRRNDLYK